METIKIMFVILMIQNGNVIEYVPTDGMSDCLKQKRIVSRSIGDNQEGMVMQCKELKTELYEYCVGGECKLRIKRIIE
tara:strand:+ start:2786 stop:3019 length:234 start_codon:yes stop_codon:yes gene_type:complete